MVCDSSLYLIPLAEMITITRVNDRRARAHAGRGIHRRTARQNSPRIVTERTRSILTHLDARF